jgi:hypothetical protein
MKSNPKTAAVVRQLNKKTMMMVNFNLSRIKRTQILFTSKRLIKTFRGTPQFDIKTVRRSILKMWRDKITKWTGSKEIMRCSQQSFHLTLVHMTPTTRCVKGIKLMTQGLASSK